MPLRSLLLTVVGTLVGLASTSCVSYVVAKYNFPGRNLIYAVAISIMLIPTIGSTSATYKLINDLGLYDNYIALILLYSGGFGFQFLLLHGVFKSISWQYAEAAYMDGASDFKVFTKVMLPMSMGTMVPLGILNAINIWNDYFTPYLYLKGKPTLAVGLQSMVNQMEYNANWPALFTLMLISMVPIIAVFIAFQKQIMANVTAGGLKG
jgi:raffinose/stachyose/melibiose transport system permease protein/N-acetylglucosamine transport system permease protein